MDGESEEFSGTGRLSFDRKAPRWQTGLTAD